MKHLSNFYMTLVSIRRTRDMLSDRLMQPGIKRRHAIRIMRAIDRLDSQAVRVMAGLPRHPHSHGYGLPAGLWKDVMGQWTPKDPDAGGAPPLSEQYGDP